MLGKNKKLTRKIIRIVTSALLGPAHQSFRLAHEIGWKHEFQLLI